METSLIIAGSGGQGILFLGKVLAYACIHEGREVTWFPSYGAEMRGGTANCTVIISDEMIGSPVVLNPDILIAMNKASLEKFLPCLIKGGTLLYDSSLVKKPALRTGLKVLAVPATKIASASGNTKSANMVMLGAFVGMTGVLQKASVHNIFEYRTDRGGNDVAKMNTHSFLEGIKFAENTKSQNIRRKRHS